VFLVDDHPIVRLGLAQMINREADLEVCGGAENGADALAAVGEAKPDIVLLDLALPGPDGIEVLQAIRTREPQLPVLILTMHDEFLYAERALRLGAKGYVMKQEASDRVITAIRQVLAGEIYVSERMAVRILQSFAGSSVGVRPSFEALTDREIEVMALVGKGQSTREIADRLHLSVKTVDAYCAHIKDKLSLRNVRELIQFAVQWGRQQECVLTRRPE
jgi:DNA-binding NarL/FixJ family response regulator